MFYYKKPNLDGYFCFFCCTNMVSDGSKLSKIKKSKKWHHQLPYIPIILLRPCPRFLANINIDSILCQVLKTLSKLGSENKKLPKFWSISKDWID